MKFGFFLVAPGLMAGCGDDLPPTENREKCEVFHTRIHNIRRICELLHNDRMTVAIMLRAASNFCE
jgi:hypothetical protein